METGRNQIHFTWLQVTCFAEAGGQHVSGMARAVHLLGMRACLTQSTMDSGHGLPSSWASRTTHDCLQVSSLPLSLSTLYLTLSQSNPIQLFVLTNHYYFGLAF